MYNSLKKIFTVFLITGLNWTGLSAVGSTLAMFNDVENSSQNVLEAGVIDFTLTDNGFDPLEPSLSMGPGDLARKIVDIVPDVLSNPFQYYASSTNFSGDEDFCRALNVDLKFDDGTKYGGDTFYSASLSALQTTATTSLDSWMYEFGTGASNFQNRVCEFDVDYNAWQTRHNYPTYEQGGFSDTEKVKNKISSWGFRINKVYYDVAPDRGSEGDNEWVEIYNQTNVDLDISGWEICDNSSCDVLPSTAPIPAFAYAVITASTTTWAFWNIPDNVRKIVLPDGNIGNRLGNSKDMLILKRPDGVIVDQMNWGVPSTNWNNYNDDVWNPGVSDTAEGNALARMPNGYDTDRPSDWKELTPPELDLIYPDEAGSYTWYWGEAYDIQWTAINHNGDDADLSIDISYIKDINHDGAISDGDIEYPIVSDTANDGVYNWTVPSGFVGYIWVKIIATGPENPMINDVAVSGDIWDPKPIFIDNTQDTAALSFLNNEGDGKLVDSDEMPSKNESQTTKEQADEEVITSDEAGEGNATEISEEDTQANNEEADNSEIEDVKENTSEKDSLVVEDESTSENQDTEDSAAPTEEGETQNSDTSSEKTSEQEQENSESKDSLSDQTTSASTEQDSDTNEEQASEESSLSDEKTDAAEEEEELDETIEKVVEVVSDGVEAVNNFVNGGSDDVKDGDEQTNETANEEDEETTEAIKSSESDGAENTDNSEKTSQDEISNEDAKSTKDTREDSGDLEGEAVQTAAEDGGIAENSEASFKDASTENDGSSEDNKDIQTTEDNLSVREDKSVEVITQDESQSDDTDKSDDSSGDEKTDGQDNNELQVI